MKKVILLISILLIFSSNVFARDFAEAQVQYIIDSEQNKVLKRSWDDANNVGSIYIKKPPRCQSSL